MFKIISITDRKQCKDFNTRLLELAQNNITFILREKDLSDSDYQKMAEYAKSITDDFIIHSRIDLAKKMLHKKIHLTMNDFLANDVSNFDLVGVSVHRIEEAEECAKRGAHYVTFSHIFETDCKKGLPPKGIKELERVCQEVSIPVYALGGINANNINSVTMAGASGMCVMSLFMRCENVRDELLKLVERTLLDI